jgi:diguanylate cyclase (GGDEF)-like protein
MAAALLLGLAVWQHAASDLHVVLTLIAVGGYTLAAAYVIWRNRSPQVRSGQVAVALLLLHAACQWARALLICLAPAFDQAHLRGIYAGVFLEALLFAFGMSSILLAMTKEQAEHRSTMKLRRLTIVDELTGLGNRRQFDDALGREVQRARLTRQPLALLMIDVDHFKMYNDTYGHLPGDACLRAIAGAIDRVVRNPDDIATRYGGEEFAVLLAATDETAAVHTANRIHASVAALRIEHATSPYGKLTISVGVAAITPRADTGGPGDLIRQADWALYVAKSEGRNGTRTASESKDSGVLRPMA